MSYPSSPPKLFLSAPHPCPYLAGETATTLILDQNEKPDRAMFSTLVNAGFRRSGDTLYRPHCRACNACVSVRIAAAAFVPNRAQRRARLKNTDITSEMVAAEFHREHFELYCKYQASRHAADGARHANEQRYRDYLVASPVDTVFLEHRVGKQLAAVSVCDLTDDGLAAEYTFFDPTLEKRSLGIFAILKQLDYVNEMQLEWLYLGYWVGGCDKMAYKTDFKPLFGFIDREWRLLEK